MGMAGNGLYKLTEESGELQQVIGKMLAYPDGDHPDRAGDLTSRLEEEIADVQASSTFVINKLNLNREFIEGRRQKKLAKYNRWDKE